MEQISFDSGDLMRDDRREELCAWVASLGVEPKGVRPQGAIVQADASYELHLSRFVRDEDDRIRIDHAKNDAVTEPLVVDLGTERTWPAWLNGAKVDARAVDDEFNGPRLIDYIRAEIRRHGWDGLR